MESLSDQNRYMADWFALWKIVKWLTFRRFNMAAQQLTEPPPSHKPTQMHRCGEELLLPDNWGLNKQLLNNKQEKETELLKLPGEDPLSATVHIIFWLLRANWSSIGTSAYLQDPHGAFSAKVPGAFYLCPTIGCHHKRPCLAPGQASPATGRVALHLLTPPPALAQLPVASQTTQHTGHTHRCVLYSRGPQNPGRGPAPVHSLLGTGRPGRRWVDHFPVRQIREGLYTQGWGVRGALWRPWGLSGCEGVPAILYVPHHLHEALWPLY